MNALALITCLYLVIVLPSFMKWLQIRAAKWIHLHLCFTASIQGKASAMSTSTFAVWACFHHSFNFHLSPWKWETVWKLRGSLREVPPFATFCHPVCHRVSAVCEELRQPHLPWVSTGHCRSWASGHEIFIIRKCRAGPQWNQTLTFQKQEGGTNTSLLTLWNSEVRNIQWAFPCLL